MHRDFHWTAVLWFSERRKQRQLTVTEWCLLLIQFRKTEYGIRGETTVVAKEKILCLFPGSALS